MQEFDVVIIGSGPAGLTAAIYTTRGGLNTAVFAGLQHGGQLTTTTEVENFPGFREPIMGPTLMADMTHQAERLGTKILYEEIIKVDFKPTSKKRFSLWTDSGQILAKTVIIATGASAKTLKLPKEQELMGRGVSTCATCDGFFFKGKKAAVVGGGDSAMEEAYYLAKLCSEVTLIHRRPEFRASNIMVERIKNHPKIKLKIPYQIVDTVSNESGLTGLLLKEEGTNKVETLEVEGLWMAIGHTPNSGIFKEFLPTDENGYLKVKDGVKTEIPGVFAAGDIADHTYRQAITAAGMGCQAGMQAIRYIETHGGDFA
jgi:thioredoxin reductase (NADPH)